MEQELAVKAEQVSLKFGDQEPLFHDLSFRIHKGEFVAIIGPNGSGKTSLIKTILGLYPVSSGEMHLYQPKVGYVPQYIQKDEFSPMTVRELLAIKIPHGTFWGRRSRFEPEMRRVLARTGMEQISDRQIRNLSGGEFQRLMIAYALIGDPGMLILDEPVSGIDVHGEQEFFGLLEKINAESGVTILMISHDIDVVYRYASQVICLNKTLVCLGKPLDVLTKETIEKTFSTHYGIYHHQHKAGHESSRKEPI
jgi:zinc transport system ATP-binding protein